MVQPAAKPAKPAKPPLIDPGTRVEHYEVIRAIGAGGMGEVYLATDLALVQKILAGERASYNLEKRYLRRDGQVVHVLLTEVDAQDSVTISGEGRQP